LDDITIPKINATNDNSLLKHIQGFNNNLENKKGLAIILE
jgi:hypothetical protein